MENENPKVGPYSLIPIESILAAAKWKARVKDVSDYDSELEYFINEGARWMNTNETFPKKSCVIDIEEGRAKLPCGFHSLIGLRPIFDPAITPDPVENLCIDPCRNDLWYGDTDFLTNCGVTCDANLLSSSGRYEIVSGQIVLTYPFPTNLIQLEIAFTGFAQADNGLMELPADYELPLSSYAAWQVLSIYPELFGPTAFQPAYFSRLNSLKSEYKNFKLSIQMASERRRFDNEKYAIKRVWQSLLHDQNKSH